MRAKLLDGTLRLLTCCFSFLSRVRQPIPAARPGLLDLKGKAKWDAWNAKKGMAQEEAKQVYIQRAKQLIETYGKK